MDGLVASIRWRVAGLAVFAIAIFAIVAWPTAPEPPHTPAPRDRAYADLTTAELSPRELAALAMTCNLEREFLPGLDDRAALAAWPAPHDASTLYSPAYAELLRGRLQLEARRDADFPMPGGVIGELHEISTELLSAAAAGDPDRAFRLAMFWQSHTFDGCLSARTRPIADGDYLSRAMITAAIATARPDLDRCGAAPTTPADAMTVKLHVRVSPAGTVDHVSISATPPQALGACVSAAVSRIHFPPTTYGGSFGYPFRFAAR